MRIDGIILAAGLSVRMGENKLRLPFRGRPLLQHAIDLAASLPLAAVILVTREETIAGMRVPENFSLVFNPDPVRGQSSSLRLGLARAKGEGYLFLQGDQPLLDQRTVAAVLGLADQNCIVVPGHAGLYGGPVFFPARYRKELMALRGDQGGRAVRQRYPQDCRFVEPSCAAALRDIDTRQEYAALVDLMS